MYSRWNYLYQSLLLFNCIAYPHPYHKMFFPNNGLWSCSCILLWSKGNWQIWGKQKFEIYLSSWVFLLLVWKHALWNNCPIILSARLVTFRGLSPVNPQPWALKRELFQLTCRHANRKKPLSWLDTKLLDTNTMALLSKI